MRPNVDIPWSKHGRIKEYAQAEDLTIEQAYREVIDEGLSVMPTSVMEDDSFLEPRFGREEFGPFTFPISAEDKRDINDICTFVQTPTNCAQPVSFKSYSTNSSVDEILTGLKRISSELNEIHKDWFTFHQLGGAWVGRGMTNFAHTLRTLQERNDDPGFDTYKTGFGTYYLEIGEREALLLHIDYDAYTGEVERLELGFLTDGHPVDGRKYRKTVSQFGLSFLENGSDIEIPRIKYQPEEDVKVDVINNVVHEDTTTDEEWVSGLVIRNPIQQREDIAERFLREADEKIRESPAYSNRYELLLSYDHVYVELGSHHPVSEEKEYSLKGISATDFTRILGTQRIWNLSMDVDWI